MRVPGSQRAAAPSGSWATGRPPRSQPTRRRGARTGGASPRPCTQQHAPRPRGAARKERPRALAPCRATQQQPCQGFRLLCRAPRARSAAQQARPPQTPPQRARLQRAPTRQRRSTHDARRTGSRVCPSQRSVCGCVFKNELCRSAAAAGRRAPRAPYTDARRQGVQDSRAGQSRYQAQLGGDSITRGARRHGR